ncbi:hypothetical protein Tco_0985783 [Tanacetum coccineum]
MVIGLRDGSMGQRDKRLLRLIDVTVEQWMDLKYGDHTMVSNEVKESVIATWLIRTYKMQLEEYMEIKKQKEVYGLEADMEYDPLSVDFSEWLALKFSNHKTMDWYTKNMLWIYWTRGDDEVVITDDELSNPEDGNLIEETKIAEIFEIETDIFQFETPLCEAFKEFNYLLKIDVDVLTDDIPGFKTYDEYKDAWIYEWNKDVPWVPNGHAKWPTYNWKTEKYFNGGDLPRVIQNRDMIYFESNEWYENLEDDELKDEALKSKAIFKGSKRDINDHAGTNNDCKIQKDEGWFDEHRLMGDDNDDIGDLEDYLIRKDPPLLF